MAPKRVTLTKDGREISLALPQEIVEHKAAGWREKTSTPAGDIAGGRVPVAASAADVPAAPKPAEQSAAKGGAKK